MFGRRRDRSDSHTTGRLVPGSGVAIYEIDGRLLIRTIDGSDSLGIERNDFEVIDNNADPEVIGRAIVEAADRAREVPRPTTWPAQFEYAAPLPAASPRHFRSYRAWQRAARYVHVQARPDHWHLQRWYPDLNRAGWQPSDETDQSGSHRAARRLPPSANPSDIGAEVIALLHEPPLADMA
jgi:hypothetical protein